VTEVRSPKPKTYLLLGLVFGILWFPLIWTYLGAIFGEFVLFTVLTIVTAQLLLRPIGRLERFLVTSLLGHDVPAPQPLRYARSTGSRWSGVANAARRVVAAFRDGHSWRVLAWVLIRYVLGPLGFVVVAGQVVVPILLLLAVLAVVFGGASSWLLLSLAGLVVLPVLPRCTDALADLHRRLATWALGPGRDEIAAAALARAAHAEEQVRIDQELHDSIGHMLSMIVVQAGAGAHVFERDAEFARRALGTIEQRGRAALGELDRIIAQFQGTHAGGNTGPNGYAPLPDAASLPALVAGAREAGVDVVARIRIGDLPAPLGRGVYRIVQEALTNAAKHAPGSTVNVDIASGEEAVAISVVNRLAGSAPTARRAAGRGLASIRDRATMLGGSASIGTTEDDEFVVNAVLPLAALLPHGTPVQCTLAPRCTCLGCAIRGRELP
jgi:signal transduction histidine kinase